jgi:mannose-6-phosphate isomerase-like protein (cupin superfamily)
MQMTDTVTTTLPETSTDTTTATPAMRFVKALDGVELRTPIGRTVVLADRPEDPHGITVTELGGDGEIVACREFVDVSYVVLAGAMEVRAGARRVLATAGDYVAVPAGEAHTIEVVAEYVKYLRVTSGTCPVHP